MHAEFRRRPTAEWTAILGQAGFMHAIVAGYDDLLAAPHVAAIGALAAVEHDGTGTVQMANVPGLPSIAPGQPGARAPHVGEHSRAILAEAGYCARAIASRPVLQLYGIGWIDRLALRFSASELHSSRCQVAVPRQRRKLAPDATKSPDFDITSPPVIAMDEFPS